MASRISRSISIGMILVFIAFSFITYPLYSKITNVDEFDKINKKPTEEDKIKSPEGFFNENLWYDFIKIAVGAIIPVIFGWYGIKRTIKIQHRLNVINNFRTNLVDIITKIDTFNVKENNSRIDNLPTFLSDCWFESDIAFQKSGYVLSSSQKISIKQKNKYHKNQCDKSKFPKGKDFDEIKQIHKKGIKEILNLLK